MQQRHIDLVRRSYQRDRYVFLPALLSSDTARCLASFTASLQSRRVVVSDHPEQWDELKVDLDHELAAIFGEDSTLTLVRAALDLPPESQPTSIKTWANRYGLGEYIPRHTDASGTSQLVICLLAPNAANGGALMLATWEGEQSYTMAPGDAILLQTTIIEHWTTPLVPSIAEPQPLRLVGVGRYYWQF